MTEEEALRLFATCNNMRPFTEVDWDAFGGCEGPNPLIGDAGGYVIIVDLNQVSFIDAQGVELWFHLKKGDGFDPR